MPRIPVTLVVVDSGPLISLAACGRLDLLDNFSRPVKVPDVIRAECLRHPEKIGANALAAWFASFDGTRREVLATPFLALWEQAVRAEEAGDTTHPSSQIGDAAITWVLGRLPYVVKPEPVVLVLLEDGPFGDGALRQGHPEIHALSTRAFLQTLQNYGRIPSAMAVFQDIVAAGRRLAKYMVDRPGIVDGRNRTIWTTPLDEEDPRPGP